MSTKGKRVAVMITLTGKQLASHGYKRIAGHDYNQKQFVVMITT